MLNVTSPTQAMEWMGLRLDTPADWQVVRHGTKPQRGRLVLVDRRRQRMQLMWARVQDEPDLNHMLEDHRARELEHDADATFQPMPRVKGWVGIQRELDAGGAMVRAAHYDETHRRLLEVVLMSDLEDDPAELTQQIIGSIEIICDPHQARRFALFDLDVAVPEHWRLTQAEVKPADVSFRFNLHDPIKDRMCREEAVVRRRGMADVWFGNDLDKVIRRSESDAVFEYSDARYHGELARMGKTLEPGKRYLRLMGKLRDRRDLVWFCKPENAVYQITTLSFAKKPIDPAEFDVLFARGDLR